MFKKNYINLNSRNVVNYKGRCYNALDLILSNKKYNQDVIVVNQNNKNNIDIKIASIIDKINELLVIIAEMNNKLARLEVDIYACSYNYNNLSKNRVNSFNEFKQGNISANEHRVINNDIDNNLEMYKKEYEELIAKFKELTEKRNHLRHVLNKYKNEKSELVSIRKEYCKNISLAKKNIEICNCNIDSVNKTLENIDMLYFSGEENILENQLQPKIKKMKKITE